jgi:cell division inhibitor SepF
MGRVMQRMWSFLGFGDHDDGSEGSGGERPAETQHPRAPIFRLHAQRSLEIVVLEPAEYEEAQTAADYLKTHRPIVLNLKNAHKDLGRRLVDFLSGVAYALDGHMHRVGDEIFLFTPHHVSITADHIRHEVASGLFPVE